MCKSKKIWKNSILDAHVLLLKHEKSFGGTNVGQTSQNQTWNQVFQHFLNFGSLVFLEMTYSDSLQQCLISSRGKTEKKIIQGPKLGHNLARNQFFCYFLKFGSLIFMEIAQEDSLEQCLTTSRDEPMKKIWWAQM